MVHKVGKKEVKKKVKNKVVKRNSHKKHISDTKISNKKLNTKISNIKNEKTGNKKAHNASRKFYSRKFCPNCGNVITDDNTLCKDCRGIDFDFKEIKLLLCNNCKSYNYKNKWQPFNNLNDVIKKIVTDSVKHHVKYTYLDDNKVEELLSYKAGVHKDFSVEVTIDNDRFDLPAVIDVTLCPKCCKQGTKYFEGILQVRNATKDIISFIKNDATKQKSKGIHINKEMIVEGEGINIDYYYTDKGYLKTIAEKLRQHFGAVIKHNAQLFSINWETSKNLYRLNVLIEFPRYSKDDVLKIDKQLFKIVSMDEKIHAVNMETHAKTLLAHKESYDLLKPVQVMLIKKYPEYEILDPTTYYQARLMNPSDKLEINQKLRVVIDGGEAWMI